MTTATYIPQSEVVRSHFANDADFAELLELFVEALPERTYALQAAVDEGDLQQVRCLTHQLKGAGGGYGFEGLTQVAGELEKACEQLRSVDLVAPYVDKLTKYIARIRA